MADDAVGAEVVHRNRAVAEGDGDDRHARPLRSVDVDDRVADHQRVLDPPAGEPDGLEEVTRVGLAHAEGVLPGDRHEAVEKSQRGKKLP